jgi:exoribonuclease R
LIRCTQGENRISEETPRAQKVADAEIAEAELLLNKALAEHIGEASPAELGREHEAGDASGGRKVPQIPGNLRVRLVDSARPGANLATGEQVAKLDDRQLLVGELAQFRRKA